MEDLQHAQLTSIRTGEMATTRAGGQLRTLLGSCLGLALYDRDQKVGGLAHILLPEASGKVDRPGKFVDTAIPALILEMERLAGSPMNLIAKIAGGASMFQSAAGKSIGLKNIEACQKTLAELDIAIVAQHCGGNQGRRMSLFSDDGKVIVEIVGQEPIEL